MLWPILKISTQTQKQLEFGFGDRIQGASLKTHRVGTTLPSVAELMFALIKWSDILNQPMKALNLRCTYEKHVLHKGGLIYLLEEWFEFR